MFWYTHTSDAGAAPEVSTTPVQEDAASSQAISFHHELPQDRYAVGEAITLLLQVSNSGNQNIEINDPFSVNGSLALKLTFEGQLQRVNIGGAGQEPPPGVPQVPQQLSVSTAMPVDIVVDLHQYFKIDRPGRYSLAVDYYWGKGQRWHSPELSFVVSEPNASAIGVVPNDASGTGFYGLFWVEADGQNSRVLQQPWRVQDKQLQVQGAVNAGIVPAGAQVTLSTQPAGDPMAERWLAATEGDRLLISYVAEDEELQLPAVSSKLPRPMTLISPILAAPVPDEGRPACTLGLLDDSGERSILYLLDVSSNGESKAQPPIALPGKVRAAWAVAATPSSRRYYFVIPHGDATAVYQLDCPRGQACGNVQELLSLEGRYLAGDLRLLGDGRVGLALLQEQQDRWVRHVVAGVPGGPAEPISKEALLPAEGTCEAELVRLDADGQSHLLYTCQNRLHYAQPGDKNSSWNSAEIGAAANLFELAFLNNQKTVLIYYHRQQGIRTEAL